MAGDWYKRYPIEFIDATQGMSLEVKGAYSICLDLMYANRDAIKDDPNWIAGVCGCSVRKWKAIRAELIEAGKLIENDGRLGNEVAFSVLSQRKKERESSSKGGRASAQMKAQSKKNKPLASSRRGEERRGDIDSDESIILPGLETPPKSARRKRKPETPYPDNFAPNASSIQHYRSGGYDDAEIRRHVEYFADKAAARDYRYRDWQAAFRNSISWSDRPCHNGNERGTNSGGKRSDRDVIFDAAERFIARGNK